jgi:hypothetical protein
MGMTLRLESPGRRERQPVHCDCPANSGSFKPTFEEQGISDSVCNAIRDRSVIEFSYDGGLRIVEPHCHGRNKNGTQVVRAFQTDGYSKSGNSSGWRLFDVDKIVGLRRTGASFASNGPGYNPNDANMSYVYSHV